LPDFELEYNYDPEEFHRQVVYVDVHSPEAFSREQARNADKRAMEFFGIPSILLMENAAIAVVQQIKEYSLCIIGKDVRVYIVGDPRKGSNDFKINLKIMSKLAPEVLFTVNDENYEEFESAVKGCEACIDAIFGTGLNRPVEGMQKKVIETMNQFSTHVVAVDIPSGLDCDTGQPLGVCVHATRTITFHRMKKGLDLSPQYGGDVAVSYVGIPN